MAEQFLMRYVPFSGETESFHNLPPGIYFVSSGAQSNIIGSPDGNHGIMLIAGDVDVAYRIVLWWPRTGPPQRIRKQAGEWSSWAPM